MIFQTCNRAHSDRLPVVDSPQCLGGGGGGGVGGVGCLVVGDLLQTFSH